MHYKFLPSFVQRKGRITKSQEDNLNNLHSYQITSHSQILTEKDNFKEIILEIGFGNGENTSFLAVKNPNALIIASEVYLSGIGSLLNSIAQNSLNNIKIYDDDVRELILNLPKNIFDEVYIICPDPWPKARHHKRRLIKHEFLKVLAKVLRKDGTVYISTDWENYAESIQEEIAKTKEHFSFQQISNDGMPITRFQQRAINEGRSIHTFLLKVLKK